MADRGHPHGVDADETPPRGVATSARSTPLGRTGRFAQELEAATDPLAGKLARQRARADRAEAALADLRRDSARAILGLSRQVTYWRLVAAGVDPADAAHQSDLAGPLDVDEPAGPEGR